MFMFTSKEANGTVCLHLTWTLQTGYRPPRGFTLTCRPVFVSTQQHHLYSSSKYPWCASQYDLVTIEIYPTGILSTTSCDNSPLEFGMKATYKYSRNHTYSPFHEMSASWRDCSFLLTALKHSVQNGAAAWSQPCMVRDMRVAPVWGSAPTLFLHISLIMVMLLIQKTYITKGIHRFIIP